MNQSLARLLLDKIGRKWGEERIPDFIGMMIKKKDNPQQLK